MNMYIQNITESSFEAWFLNYFEQEAINRMASNGVEVCGELTYYANTSLLFERFQPEIWQLAQKYSEDYLDENLLMTLSGDRTISSPATFTTAIVLAASDCLARRHQRDETTEEAEDQETSE
jgi:hypothetical protein